MTVHDNPAMAVHISSVSQNPKINKVAPGAARESKSPINSELRSAELKENYSNVLEVRHNVASELTSLRESLEDIAETLNSDIKLKAKRLQFTVDEITNRVVLTVSDKESGEIIRQIPSSQVLKAAHNIEQLKGILFDDIF